MLQKNRGEFNEAEKGFTETLAINEKTSGNKSMPYAITLNNRGVLYQNLGRYKQAEKDIQECLVVAATNINTKSAKYARFQTNLGLLYQQEKKYEEADTLYQELLNRCQNKLTLYKAQLGLKRIAFETSH